LPKISLIKIYPLISRLKKTFLHISFRRYLAVGLINTSITLSIIYLLKLTINLNDIFANVIGYSAGLTVSFFVNKKWTFNSKSNNDFIYFKFISVFAVAYFANLLVVMFSINYLNIDSYISHAIGIPAYTVIGYLGNRFFVFRKKN